MQRIVLSLKLRPASANDNGQARALRLLGIVPLALGAILAWKSHWFYADKNLSRYPEIRLTYTTSKFEHITHSCAFVRLRT